MSWTDRTDRKLSIFTGDGKTYYPEYLNAQKVQDFNVSVFNFVGVKGSLIKRKQPTGRKFKIEIIFKGSDHLDVSDEFEESANDSRHWHINHPIYGRIRVQPLSLNYDNSIDSYTKITGTVIETILGVYPEGLIQPVDEALVVRNTSNDASVFAFTNTTEVQGNDVKNMFATVETLENNTLKEVDSTTDLGDYLNLMRETRASISRATSDTIVVMQNIKDAINAPTLLNIGVFATQKLLLKQFEQLKNTILGEDINSSSVSERQYFEAIGAIILAAVYVNAINVPVNTYSSKIAVIDNINTLITSHNDFIETLDLLQLSDFTQSELYIPNNESMQSFDDLFSIVVGNMYQIASEAKQEKIVNVDKDTNVLLLTHKFYGLDIDDENIDYLINTNNLGLNMLLNIQKGTEIKYYK